MVQFITTPRKPSLGELLGTGISKGLETGITARLKQQALTPYQALSTKLRAKEQERKIQSGITQAFLKEADPFMKGDISTQDVSGLSASAYKIAKQEGLSIPEAMQEAKSRFKLQQSSLADADLPTYKTSKAPEFKKEIIKSLKEEGITNTTLINRDLKGKKWPAKDRKEILKSLRRGILEKKEAISKKEKVKFNPQNPEHIRRRNEILTKTKGNRKQAKQLLDREFE
jgi:hypothetical protein